MTSFSTDHSRIYNRIYNKNKDINARQTIPPADIAILGKRLVLVCTVPPTQQRASSRTKRSENREYLVQSRERKAWNIYSEVLEKFPDIFLAFILTVAPKACCQFSVGSFFQQHTKQPILLSNDANVLLWQIATSYGIEKTSRFQKLIRSLFRQPPPTTDADGERKWSLVLSDLAAVRICLGDTICDAIQCSPKHNPKPVDSQFSETSECVEARVPFDADQDAIMYINVGSALKLADMLFPAASERIASILPKFSPVILQPHGPGDAVGAATQSASPVSEIDFAYFTLRGASVPAIKILFGTSIYEGIDESELRNWEKDHLLLDTTDCITMQLRRAQPEHGIIRLRVGFWAGVNLVNELYATNSEAAMA